MTIAFDFEAFLLSADVQAMKTIEVGAYILLLAYCSVNKNKLGYVRNDANLLKKITRLTDEQWDMYAPNLLGKFEQTEDGFIYNKRLLQSVDDAQKSSSKKNHTTRKKQNNLYDSPEQIINLISINETFAEIFIRWIRYKQVEKRFTYKSVMSLQEAYNNLLRLSEYEVKNAEEIVSFSIANGYLGLFKPRYSNNNNNDTKRKSLDYLEQLAIENLRNSTSSNY